MKYNTMERCVIPNCWKVWMESKDGETIECVGIFKTDTDAHLFGKDFSKEYLVTRASTITINKDENN